MQDLPHKEDNNEKISVSEADREIRFRNKKMESVDEKVKYGKLVNSNHCLNLSEIGTQTSFPVENVNASYNVSEGNRKVNIKRQSAQPVIEDATISQLKTELEAAKAKIKKLEEERIEVEKRRSIEITSKYVPTSFTR